MAARSRSSTFSRSRSSTFNRSRSSSFQGEAAVLPICSSDVIPSTPPDYNFLYPGSNSGMHYPQTTAQYSNTVTDQLEAQSFVDFPTPTISPVQLNVDAKQPPSCHLYQPKVHPAFAIRPNDSKSAVRQHYHQSTVDILQTASNYLTDYLSSVTCGLLETDSDTHSAVNSRQKLALLTKISNKAEQPKEAQPITPDILRRLHATLDLTKVDDIRFWAICLTGFYGLVRKSSLGVKGALAPHTLLRANVSLQGQHISLGIPGGKRTGFPIYWHLARAADPRLCPWTAMRAWMPYWPCNTDRGVFEMAAGRSSPYPTYTWMEARLRRALRDADIKGTYTIHSFRLGGAACAEAAGIPYEIVQQLGGWKSGPGLKSRESRLMAERFTEYVCRNSA